MDLRVVVFALGLVCAGRPTVSHAARLPRQEPSAINADEMVAASVSQMGSMVACTTVFNLVEAGLAYNGYGCYCGFGGKGNPVDETDRCCYEHDACYSSSPCEDALKYSIPYKYSKSSCDTDSASITCKSASDYPFYYGSLKDCAAFICNCDKEMALCYKKVWSTYNLAYRNWDSDNC